MCNLFIILLPQRADIVEVKILILCPGVQIPSPALRTLTSIRQCITLYSDCIIYAIKKRM